MLFFLLSRKLKVNTHTRVIQKVRNVYAYSPGTCFVAADHWFLVFSVILNYLTQLYVGPCRVVSAEIVVAFTVPIENPADCEVRGVIRFQLADEILGYLAEEASSRVELFCCMIMHVGILPGKHKSCCVSNSIGTSSSILRIVRTWHRRTFSCFQKWSTLLVNASQMMETRRMLWAATWYELVPRYNCLNIRGEYVE